MLYDDIKQMIEEKVYTIVQCQNMLNNYYKYMQLTDEQYDELMELSKGLEPNNPNDYLDARFEIINQEIAAIKSRLETITQAIEGAGTVVPPVEEADGSEFNPITAYKGLYYKANLYYLDPTNNEVYKCRETEETLQSEGKQLTNLPHELVNVYFDWVRKEA